ncbi:phage tail protein I [Acinetobacter towneri]|uniref:phage tail protein I n=1 Tax=Acinetobacter towneri TaxID=202956 RepID=UPI001CE100FC|nr:phage tail protein I [Acinetobacter towneri]MCA4779751.1 phage tail protein I [Acinetobacter towneri]MCA4784912.1 phage tail protein I [Acinetobacter towneri]MCA4788080.1 phage tail protein I [Acinetobacter towneri]MCA4796054.1 phage tail protein I [Acinetobacter towneri]MCA4801265.1 phage tail protein I [Acinetobacter towneri]
MKSLLPPNHTALEKNIASAGGDAFDIASIKVIKNIDEVPMQFLSFLAYQKSVDYWDESWQDDLKRQVIKDAKEQHKIKGTAAAIKQALEPFGYEVTLIEWFKAEPNLVPGTFNLELNVIGKSLNAETYSEINRLVSESKAASRHLANLTVTINPILTIRNLIVHQTALTYTSEPRV